MGMFWIKFLFRRGLLRTAFGFAKPFEIDLCRPGLQILGNIRDWHRAKGLPISGQDGNL
jgi:hypothetical protein